MIVKSAVQILVSAALGTALCVTGAGGAWAADTGAGGALEAPVPADTPTPKSAAAPSLDALWQELAQTPFIREGADDAHAKGMFYAFFDPNCIFCHLAWRMTQPYLEHGLQVRWIPIAFVMPDSAAKAAWIITSPDPAAALNAGESGWKKGVRDGGGAFKQGPVTAAVQARLKANEDLFTRLGLDATPSFVYKDADGTVRTMPGLSDMHMISKMSGLPYIPNDDPELARIRE